jgi:hypothetical protein
MTIFLTLGVSSIRVQASFPLQSNKIPLMTIYFLLGSCYTFLALCWFAFAEILKSKEQLSPVLCKFADLIKLCFFCCFPKAQANKVTNENANEKSKISQEVVMFVKMENCNKCDFCAKCLMEKEKDKQKADKGKEKLSRIKALNYFAFTVLFTLELISFSGIWIGIGMNNL